MTIRKTIIEAEDRRVFVTTDPHGCMDAINRLIEKVNFSHDNDMLVIAGDAIDRGPDSAGVLDFINAHPNVFCIKGNHEWLAINALKEPDTSSIAVWLMNGGEWGLEHPKIHEYVEQMSAFPDIIEIRKNGKVYGVIHAEPDCNDWQKMGSVNHNTIVWGRDRLRFFNCRGTPTDADETIIKNVEEIYCGHTIVDHPTYTGNVFHMDMGAFLGKDLFHVEL